MSLRIYVELDESDLYRLMCDDGRMSPQPCGPRLFRAPPHPQMKFTHDDPESAETDARKLRVYLAGLTEKKTKKRTAEGAA